jgi:hypothetical protein
LKASTLYNLDNDQILYSQANAASTCLKDHSVTDLTDITLSGGVYSNFAIGSIVYVYGVLGDSQSIDVFGNSKIGASTASNNAILGSKFTLTRNAVVTSINAYMGTDSHGDFAVAIYDSSLHKIYSSGNITYSANTWATVSGLSISLTAGDYYLCGLGYWWQSYYNTGTTNQGFTDWTHTTFASTLQTDLQNTNVNSIYATYT